MPRLHTVLPVLEHNLNKFSKISVHDRSGKVGISSSGRIVRNASKIVNPTNLKVISQFHRCITWNIWHTVNSISLLSIYIRSRVCKHYCLAWLDHSVVVGALRIRPRSACSQIPTVIYKKIKNKNTNEWTVNILKKYIMKCITQDYKHEYVPNGSSLKEWSSNVCGRSKRDRARNLSEWVAVVKNCCCGKYPSCKPCWYYDVIVLRRLISSDQHRIRLPKMDVKWCIDILKCMRAFYFYQFHFMPLNSEVNGCCKPHIWYSKPICFSCIQIYRWHEVNYIAT